MAVECSGGLGSVQVLQGLGKGLEDPGMLDKADWGFGSFQSVALGLSFLGVDLQLHGSGGQGFGYGILPGSPQNSISRICWDFCCDAINFTSKATVPSDQDRR